MTDDEILDRTLTSEGGYQNDLADSGNRNADGVFVGTNWGITPETYTRFYNRVPSADDIRHLTVDQAKDIYRTLYLAPFDAVHDWDIKQELVDFAINCGVVTAIRAFQQACGVPPDGKLGPRTIATFDNGDRDAIDKRLTEIRIERSVDAILAQPAKRKYLTGWLRRILQLG